MVIFFKWHPAAMEQTSRSGLPLSGEETDLEALSSPLVGYLGKVQKRAASLEDCPWCMSKGLTFALRSYRISLQESISLCTNPQCLFPLVSQPLEDVLASLVPVDHPVGCKRNNKLAPGKENLNELALKRRRSNEPDEEHSPSTLPRRAEQDAPAAAEGEVNGCHRDSLAVEERSDAPGPDEDGMAMGPEEGPRLPPGQPFPKDLLNVDGVGPVPSSPCGDCGLSGVQDVPRSPPETASSQNNGPSEHTSARTQVDGSEPDAVEDMETSGLFPFPAQLFWQNSASLCWLDSMLVALVNCKSLKKSRPDVEPRQSTVWRLIREHEDVGSAVQGHRQTGSDGVARVPQAVLEKSHADLDRLRMSVFQQLQPKLHCKLGKKETPVFALPLLLAMDAWAEPLFRTLFHWEFKCTECGAATKERIWKTLPTFTDVVTDWHPLRAVHLAPCNRCSRSHQRRTMTLESVPPVFGLHFVQGLPSNDTGNYSFTFNRNHYSISTVIQYKHHLKHFVTWICHSNGSWQEYDDLKHPECRTHSRLPVPAEEMHIVFWEVEEGCKEPAGCSPSSSFSVLHPPDHPGTSKPGGGEENPDELWDGSPDESLVIPHNDTAIISALTAPGETTAVPGSAAVDTSIGSTTLLDAFEGLSHDDIITFTLVDVTPDYDAQAVKDSGQKRASGAPITDGIPDSTPDSSTAEPATTSLIEDSSPEPEPAPVTGAGAWARGRSSGRLRAKKAHLSKIDADLLSPASLEPLSANDEKPASGRGNAASPQTTPQTSPVSSRGPPPLTTTQSVPSSLGNRRWSYLLSKNPLFPNKRPGEGPVPPAPHAQSTPNPMKRPQGPGGQGPRPQLKKDDGSVPLKAAAMYNSFGIKTPVPPSPPSRAPVLLPGPAQNTTSPPPAEEGGRLDMLSSRRLGSHSAKIPLGVSDTEALRYKLMKKLKAKKKKLAKLNEMLGSQGADSTHVSSPATVTSSTYEGAAGDSLLLDLLSPATTASNLSPDSTSFMEMMVGGQEGGSQRHNGAGAALQGSAYKMESDGDNFLDEFISQVASQRPTEMETEALSALDLFV